jgi:hypothetical protein
MGFKKIIVSESGNSKKISVPMGAQVLKIKNIAQLKDQLWAKSYSAVNKEVGA